MTDPTGAPDARPVLLVVGAGPGVGGAVARRYAEAGYDVALLGREAGTLEEVAATLAGTGAEVGWSAVDVTDAPALTAAVGRVAAHTGRVDVLHFNPSAYRARSPLELSVEELLTDVGLGAGALLTAVQAALPWLGADARVTATGSVAADRPAASAASLGVQKAALRNLVHSLDASLRGRGVRAVSVTVDGVLEREDASSPLHPDAVAAALFDAAHQDPARWVTELRHPDRTRGAAGPDTRGG